MFLFVNPEGYRHVLYSTFQELLRGFKPTAETEKGTFCFSILNSGRPGSYDLVLNYVKESVSGFSYIKGFIIENPKNKPYFSSSRAQSALEFAFTFRDLQNRTYKGKKYDIMQHFPTDVLVNGYVKIGTEIPSTILDNSEELDNALTKFFKQLSPVTERRTPPQT